MNKPDGRRVAKASEQRLLRLIFKFGALSAKAAAALVWHKSRSAPRGEGFQPLPVTVSGSMLRMAQRTLRRLLARRLVYAQRVGNGAQLYGLSEAGARLLREGGIPATSSRDWLRKTSEAQYHHARIATELAILAILDGYRVTSEREIARGQWFGGTEGIFGKVPDGLLRTGDKVYWLEAERSRRNQPSYLRLLGWLERAFGSLRRTTLPGGLELERAVFACTPGFQQRLVSDLKKMGWTDALVSRRLTFVKLLHFDEARFIMRGKDGAPPRLNPEPTPATGNSDPAP